MSNITPKTPSHTFGYWRPWKDNSNFIDSYLDYSKDVSLTKYGADTVGKYINQASKQQVQAINQLGQAIGRGMNVLSNKMSDINQTLGFLNRNMDIQIEQQKLSNLLLQNIVELLRVPDSEKERQHSIELGIKFFVNANKDSDLYADSLEELLKAESLMKQDYFVLHRIGCIYLHVNKFINPEKALDYFIKAAKYASVESDPKAMRLLNALRGNLTLLYKLIPNDNYYYDQIKLCDETISKVNDMFDKIYQEDASAPSEPRIPGRYHKSRPSRYPNRNELNKMMDLAITSKKEIEMNRAELENLNKNGMNEKEAQEMSLVFQSINVKCEIITFIKQSDEIDISEIQYLAAGSYEKAAFASYVLGRFEDAVNYQAKALKFDPVPQNRFLLSKYQVRNSNIQDAIVNLSECIDQLPTLAIAAFKEIDLINEPEVIKLITEKNDAIDNKIKQLAGKWKTVESTKANEVINELTELSQKSYEIKIADFNKYEKEGNTINTGITELEANIDAYINEIKKTTYCTFDADKIQTIIKELVLAKDLPLEKMQEVFDQLNKELDADKLIIGAKNLGGIVLYIDLTGKHGLVCADKDFGKAIWGGAGKIGTENNVVNYEGNIVNYTVDCIADGSGMANTKKIVELASWYIQEVKDGWFSKKQVKTPAPTAARLCLESIYNGYNDWYLPSQAELDLLYQNKDKIGGFEGVYLCSSEWGGNPDLAVAKNFNNGETQSAWRDNEYNVRAVRAF